MHSVIEITVSAKRAEAFEAALPALLDAHVNTGPSRAGNVLRVRILRGAHTDSVNKFLLIAETSGPVGLLQLIGDTAFAEFKAKTKDRGDFASIAEWSPPPHLERSDDPLHHRL